MTIPHKHTWHFYNKRGVSNVPAGTPVDPIPVGSISMFISNTVGVPAGVTLPDGWLLCNGASHPTASYPVLAPLLGPPAVNFTVPNFSAKIPLGAGALPPNTTAGTDHTASTHINNSSHRHTNTHEHTVSPHKHPYPHSHAEHGVNKHDHSVATFTTAQQVTTTNIKTGGATDGALGSASGTPHFHLFPNINTGFTAATPILTYRSPLLTGASVVSPSNGNSTPFSYSGIPTVNETDPLLPPYLNVYFIIKAVDFTGVYI